MTDFFSLSKKNVYKEVHFPKTTVVDLFRKGLQADFTSPI